MTDDLLVRWLHLVAARVADARERLTDLDAAIGDGDHGINLDRGFREAAGRTLMGTVGGASGALYGRGFQRAGAALVALGTPGPARVLPPDPAWVDGRALTPGSATSLEARAGAALGAAVDAIAALGRATTGEKTMLDALVPAREAYLAALRAGASLADAAARAADAADAGAERTIPLLATKGRASYLGERSIGHLDPGAASSAILLRALADVAAER